MKKLLIITLILAIFACSIVLFGCRENKTEPTDSIVYFDLNHSDYKYLFREDSQDFSFGINPSSTDSEYNALKAELLKKDPSYFDKYAIISLKLNITEDETDVRVLETKSVGEKVLVNIGINSNANKADYFTYSYKKKLFVEISKDSVEDLNNIELGILIINDNEKSAYRSTYFNCSRKSIVDDIEAEITEYFELNNPVYEYLFFEKNNYNAVKIFQNQEQISEVETLTDISKYDSKFFENNAVVMFSIHTNHEETNTRIINTKRIEENFLINIGIESSHHSIYQGHTQDISTQVFFTVIPKLSLDEDLSEVKVGFLVVNEKYKNIFASVYYDCMRNA